MIFLTITSQKISHLMKVLIFRIFIMCNSCLAVNKFNNKSKKVPEAAKVQASLLNKSV